MSQNHSFPICTVEGLIPTCCPGGHFRGGMKTLPASVLQSLVCLLDARDEGLESGRHLETPQINASPGINVLAELVSSLTVFSNKNAV